MGFARTTNAILGVLAGILVATTAAAAPGQAGPPGGGTCARGQVCRPGALQMPCVVTAALPVCTASLKGQTRCDVTRNCEVFCNGSAWACQSTAAAVTYTGTAPVDVTGTVISMQAAGAGRSGHLPSVNGRLIVDSGVVIATDGPGLRINTDGTGWPGMTFSQDNLSGAARPTGGVIGVARLPGDITNDSDGGDLVIRVDGGSIRLTTNGGSSSAVELTALGVVKLQQGVSLTTDGGLGSQNGITLNNPNSQNRITATRFAGSTTYLNVVPESAPTSGDSIFAVASGTAGTQMFRVKTSGTEIISGDLTTGASSDILGGRLVNATTSMTAGTFTTATSYLRSIGVATGSLPTCNAGLKGAFETDTTLSCAKFCDGSAWSGCLVSAPLAINNYWSSTCFGTCSEDVNMTGGIYSLGGSVTRMVCSWGTAGVGGTTGVVVKVRNVTGASTLCTCTVGACTIAANTPTSCTCSGAFTAASLYVAQLDGTTDCDTNPSNVVCTASVTP